ncbi:MAG: threonine/serine exporter family protein [Clostridiaceae bacterium]
MMILKSAVLAFLTTIGFSILFNIERRKALVAALGGSMTWVVYEQVYSHTGHDLTSLLIASIAIGIYSEIMARRMKSPSTIFYIPGFITLVPGANIYYTMLEAARSNKDAAMEMFMKTILKSGAISLGLIVASAIVAVILNFRKLGLKNIKKGLKNN